MLLESELPSKNIRLSPRVVAINPVTVRSYYARISCRANTRRRRRLWPPRFDKLPLPSDG